MDRLNDLFPSKGVEGKTVGVISTQIKGIYQANSGCFLNLFGSDDEDDCKNYDPYDDCVHYCPSDDTCLCWADEKGR